MTTKKPANESQTPANSKKHRGILYLTLFSLISLVLIVTIVIWKIQSDIDEVYSPSKNREGKKQSSPSTKDLLGQWRRTDGGYVIEIRTIDTQGRLDVSYYNPNPINVSQAEVKDRGEMLGIFLELWDEGYPGSTYELTYDSAQDLLYGTYYTPVAGQSFEVMFVRISSR
ncbi:MAG: hypothetical protein JSW33_01230 [bacterium]|nr:MAG: hypothetical protein JSW33_01230 [bacterium]